MPWRGVCVCVCVCCACVRAYVACGARAHRAPFPARASDCVCVCGGGGRGALSIIGDMLAFGSGVEDARTQRFDAWARRTRACTLSHAAR